MKTLSTQFKWKLARLLAWLLWDMVGLRRALVLKNLRWARGAWPKGPQDDTQFNSLGRLSYAHFLMTLLEFIESSWKGFGHIPTHIENRHHLDAAIRENKGVYILCGHLGNWELMAYTGSRAFGGVHVVVKPVGGKRISRWVNKVRGCNGMGVIDRSKESQATRQIFKLLAQGQLVAFMADQRRKKGALAPFFGRMAHTNVGLFQLWQRRPAPIVPCAMVRHVEGGPGGAHYTLTFLPPLVPEATPQGDTQGPLWLAHNGARMNRAIETLIRKAPEQYFWLHDRWKGAGEPVAKGDSRVGAGEA